MFKLRKKELIRMANGTRLQTKIIARPSVKETEQAINEFTINIPPTDIIDIKFNTPGGFIAMIMYKTTVQITQ